MRTRRLVWVAVAAWLQASGMSLWGGETKPAARPALSPQAWTLDEAVRQALRNRHDPYLQFVVLQLGCNENKADEVAGKFDVGRSAFSGFLLPVYSGDPSRQDERQMPQLAGFFTGALAVHENLQLQTLRGASLPAEAPPDQVAVSTLAGVTAEAHPWEKLLAAQVAAGRSPRFRRWRWRCRRTSTSSCSARPASCWSWPTWAICGVSSCCRASPRRRQASRWSSGSPRSWSSQPIALPAALRRGRGRSGLDRQRSVLSRRHGRHIPVRTQATRGVPAVHGGGAAAAVKARPDAVRETGTYQGVAYTHVATPDLDPLVRRRSAARAPRPLEFVDRPAPRPGCARGPNGGRSAGDATGRDGRVQVHPHAPPARRARKRTGWCICPMRFCGGWSVPRFV